MHLTHMEAWPNIIRTMAFLVSPRSQNKCKNLFFLLEAYWNSNSRKALRSYFDASYYMEHYLDVARSGVNPLCHYALRGHLEGRNPSAQFHTRGYLRRYPDVARAGLNPLLHYAVCGIGEGRKPASHSILGPKADPTELHLIDPFIHLGKEAGEKPGFMLALPFIAVGGAETLLRTLSRALVENGYRLIVVTTLALPPHVKDDSASFAEITPFVYPLPLLFGNQEDRWEDFLCYLLVHYRVRTIMAAGCEFMYHLMPSIRQEFPAIRIVDQLFNHEVHLPNNRQYAQEMAMTIVPSLPFAETLLNKYGERPERVSVIPHGVSTIGPQLKDRAAALAASGLPAEGRGKFLVSFFGRLSQEKAPDVFVEITRRLKDHSGIYFCMTGEGQARPAVLKLIERYKLESRIYAPGFIDHSSTLMELSDVVVVPSRADGMPLVVLEAQALGKPVVASAVGSIPEMITDGESGFLCEPDNVAAFCERILELFDSFEKRSAMGAAAREAVRRRHDVGAMTAAYLEVLQKIHQLAT